MTNTTTLAANALRILCADAVENAKGGHPGMPLGMADIMSVFWREVYCHHPLHPNWPNRDRFVLSNGHGSILLYAALHLSGYDLPLAELKKLRQLHSLTPGHPEFGLTVGVEATTGPLGQGLAMAVGMAWAAKQARANFNTADLSLFDHHTYAFVGDGDLMEGVSHEAASLAGTWQLSGLTLCYDANNISIDGEISTWYAEDVAQRFRAYGWYVVDNIDGHDQEQIRQAFRLARQQTRHPTLLIFKTCIGFGSGNLANTAKSHGAPLGPEALKSLRQVCNWSSEPFDISAAAYETWDQRPRGQKIWQDWQQCWQKYQDLYPLQASELKRRWYKQLPENWSDTIQEISQSFVQHSAATATRHSSLQFLSQVAPMLPELVGGSADLSESNGTMWAGAQVWQAQLPQGRYCHFGVREFGMSAWANGVSLYGLHRPMVATFLAFNDYARSAVRLSALMQQPVIYVYSHDSLALGGDGPTHQPVEQLASLRLIPHIEVWRPADGFETAVAWQQAIWRMNGPTCLILSRQKLAQVSAHVAETDIAHGGYILHNEQQQLQLIIIATGSEIELAVEAVALVDHPGIRIVSMPCLERFAAQTKAYQDQILPPTCKLRLAVEAAHPISWWPYVGEQGKIIAVDKFGLSGPGEEVMQAYGFTAQHLRTTLLDMLDPKKH